MAQVSRFPGRFRYREPALIGTQPSQRARFYGGRGIILTRDRFLIWFAAVVSAAGLAIFGFTQAAPAAGDKRTIAFYNVNTKESLEVIYKQDGRYIDEAMQQINHMMRDWRRDEATEMDPGLVDLVWELHEELGSQKPIHLISGYRSLKTNNALRRRGGGQARKSQHIQGKAADIHFPDVSVKQLRNSALIREIGGVGYYPTSGIPFVHVDTDRVRHWPRLPRQELALLFPSGRSQHVPSDGKPVTKKDYRIALAKVRETDPSYGANGRPKVILASLGSGSLPLAFGSSRETVAPSDDITASIPMPARRPGAKVASLPSAGDNAPVRVTRPRQVDDTLAGSIFDDPDHPDLLDYKPNSALAMLGSEKLSHPDLEQAGYWLMELSGGQTYSFEPQSGGNYFSDTAQFAGPAVRSAAREDQIGSTAQKSAAPSFRTALR